MGARFLLVAAVAYLGMASARGMDTAEASHLEKERNLAHLELDLETGLADVKYVESMMQNTKTKLDTALHDVQAMLQKEEDKESIEAVPETPLKIEESADASADARAEDDSTKATPAENEPAAAPEAEDDANADAEADAEADADADASSDGEKSPNLEEDNEPEPEPLDVADPDPALEGEEDFEQDVEVIALLQEDDMNDMEDEQMIMAPRTRPLSLMQSKQQGQDDPPQTLVREGNPNQDSPPTAQHIDQRDRVHGPIVVNKEGGNADVDASGRVSPRQAFNSGAEEQQIGVDTVGDQKADAAPPHADDPESHIEPINTGMGVPGGSNPTPPSEKNTDPSDVVCMCKRQGAPKKMKGFDRVKCKKHPSPTPTPPPPVEGIRQCVTGTWTGVTGSTPDANTTDTICIYFPARLPTPPEVNVPEREFPDECYDDRNEFVAEGIKKRPWDQFLLQEGFEAHHFEACGCSS